MDVDTNNATHNSQNGRQTYRTQLALASEFFSVAKAKRQCCHLDSGT